MKIKNLILSTAAASMLFSTAVTAQDAPAAEAAESAQEDTSMSALDKLPEWMKQMYVGAGIGSAFAFTDIKQYPSGFPALAFRTELGYGVNGIIGYKINPSFALEGNLTWSRLNGTKRDMSTWFRSSVLQWDLGVRYNLANAFHKKSIETRKFDVYVLGGFGISAFRTSRHVLVNATTVDPIVATEGYESFDLDDTKRKTFEASLYGGLGVSYRVNDMIDIYADFKGFLLNTDRLDAFESANDSRDKYNYNSLGVIFHLGGRGAARNESKKDPESAMDELMEKFKDTDGDGVADYVDKDNNTPAGVKVYADGTPVDTDGDGVADYLDQEQVSPCKDVDANGVAKDADTDGVADCNDSEPNTAAGAQVDSKGATIVTKAATPGLPTPVSNSGEATSDNSGVITGLPSVFFPSNSTTVGYKNYNALTQVAQFMKANPTAKMIVVGNSDKSGTASYNKVLGEKRAQGVVNYLVTRNGIDSSRFTVQSKGSDDPISTRRNSGQDRRVDFLLGQ